MAARSRWFRIESRALALVILVGACSGESSDDPPAAAAPAPNPRGVAPPPSKAPAPPPTTVLYDFIANRPLAHRFRGESWVVHAHGGHFDKLIPFAGGRWRLEKRGERPAAALLGTSARLRVPERALDLGADHLRIALWARRPGSVTIESSGAAVAVVEVTEGWQEAEVALRGSLTQELTFSQRPRSNVSIGAFAFGRGELEPLPDATRVRELSLETGATLSYYMHLPEGAVIEGEATPSSCEIAVSVVGLEASLEATPVPVAVEGLRDRVGRVDIGITGCERATIERLVLTTAGAPAVAPRRGPPPANVILWVMDTLRADRISVINPGARPEIPGFERLAARGVVFRRAWVEGNESQTSHASIWTSLFPAIHEVRSAGSPGNWKILDRFATLGEHIRASGRQTMGLTANGMVTRGGGYARGFHRFENPMRDGTGKRRNGWIPAHRLYKRAIEILEPLVDTPFFLFFGTIDTHKPWVGHQPWLDRYDPAPYRGKFKNAAWPGDLGLVAGSMRCTQMPKPRDLVRINAIYDSDVSYQDKHLGMMLDWLSEKGILEDTLIIVTADHGEELFEVGRCGHGASLRETLVNVPLVMSYPKRLPSGVVVEEGVDGVDILPTVLDLIGTQRPGSIQGASLVGLAHGVGRGYPRASYASQYEYAHAMRIGDWKLRVGKGVELYDLAADPEEKTSIVGRSRMAEQLMSDSLNLFLRRRWSWRKTTWGTANNLTREAALALERVAPPR